MASETFDADGPAKRPSVQVGDPFMEKRLHRMHPRLFAENLISGIQDLGAAGLRLRHRVGQRRRRAGMHVQPEHGAAARCTAGPEEILMTESQNA